MPWMQRHQKRKPVSATVVVAVCSPSLKNIAVRMPSLSISVFFSLLTNPGILAVLLNNGECPTTGVRLVSERTVAEMFTNQIPQFPQFGRQGGTTAKPELANPMPDLYPTAGNTPQGWGLSCMLTGGATGRSKSTGWWAGLANLFWWVDRENGVGGMVCSQVLALGDAKVMGAWFALETAVYAALREERRSEYGRL